MQCVLVVGEETPGKETIRKTQAIRHNIQMNLIEKWHGRGVGSIHLVRIFKIGGFFLTRTNTELKC